MTDKELYDGILVISDFFELPSDKNLYKKDDWNWLMNVVEMIETDRDFEVNITATQCYVTCEMRNSCQHLERIVITNHIPEAQWLQVSKWEAAFKAVVDSIKWMEENPFEPENVSSH